MNPDPLYLPTHCHECGGEIKYCYDHKDRLAKKVECFLCDFWSSLVGKDGIIVVRNDGKRHHYQIGPDTGEKSWKGFGGDRWRILFEDGRVIETTDLWHQGDVPERFHDRFPVTARFINAEEHQRHIQAVGRLQRRKLNAQAEQAEDDEEWDRLGATQIIDIHELARIVRVES